MHLTGLLVFRETSVEETRQIPRFKIEQNAMKICKASVAFTEPEQVLHTSPSGHICCAL